MPQIANEWAGLAKDEFTAISATMTGLDAELMSGLQWGVILQTGSSDSRTATRICLHGMQRAWRMIIDGLSTPRLE